MKRVLIFSTSYSPLWGGAEIAIKEITNRLGTEDLCFDMVTMRHDKTLPKFEKIGNINVHRVNSSKLLFPFSAYLKALSLHRKNKYDIVWSMMAGRNGFASLFFKLTNKKVKYLLTLQEGDRLSYPKERAGVLWLFVGGLFKKVFTKADSIQVISKYLEKWARDMGYKGEIEVVPNGADLEKFQITKNKLQTNYKKQIEKLKSDLGIEEDEKVIITTSRLVEKNAVDDIVRALTFLPDNYKLLIAGGGELFYKLRKLTDDLQLTKRVLFLGNIEHEQLPQYLHISDVFVRPSLSEGLGSSFIEAMAASVPVIATEVGGITDFLKDGKTGLFCGIHDPRGISEKIELLVDDDTLRESIIKNALELVERTYDWNLIAKNMKEKVFDKLNTKKNILITTGLFPPDIGGPATYSKLLLEELPKHGINVSVLSFGEVRHLPKFIRHIVYFFKILKKGRSVDIIYAQDPVSVGLPSALASKILRKKFLLKVVGDYAWEQFQVQNVKRKMQNNDENDFVTPEEFQSGKYDFKTEMRRKVERWVAKRAYKIITPSEYLKKIVSIWGATNIDVIYNGFKYDNELGKKETLRTLLQFEGDLIISVGRLVPWKGFDALVEIFPNIKDKFLPAGRHGKNAKLIIAGSGPDSKRLQKLVDEKNLGKDIAFTGELKRDVLLRYIRASDVFVLNTGYEGFSHQLLEVMNIGTPIVTTNICGNPELIQDGENGLLTGFNDKKELEKAIIKLLNDKDYSNKLAEQAKTKVQEFGEERMLKDTAEMLKNIC